jgi:hypothetical protein
MINEQQHDVFPRRVIYIAYVPLQFQPQSIISGMQLQELPVSGHEIALLTLRFLTKVHVEIHAAQN